jgi:hypothetical protein
MHLVQVQSPYAMARKRQQGIHTGKATATRFKPKLQTERAQSSLGCRQQAQPLATFTPNSLASGSVVPNLYWTAVPMDQLRHYHATPMHGSTEIASSVRTAPFVGLPSAQKITVTDDPTTFM